ncbi:NADPH:quinone reductase-like Zn-dependent oxidoreductase [Arcticibacter tournemirensis]|uniref:NADP-dependent oxidoreductase n=1 Tax=Arcticibacter tournemirensis TaxID=699437 RepID=A0A5M9GPG8_9SPHI|nr:NADP-dependent oxidoreductase [Arcticibacter tournemirensis]KAA8475669.1 NADP-dependent oxidoreductase [Arcticibacter tournemirensis]TQM50788.1 NADPH:quinone reductase-like Zn-dependent oxidoreductase [Arcticibacter tournemirensis]
MKAIAYKEFGTTAVLQIVEQPRPTITADQVLVKIKAFSINPMDWKIRKGEMTLMSGSKFPKHTGADFAGIVEEIGASVVGVKKGDEVFGAVKNMKAGASAEYVVITSSLIWKKPANISFAQAASIPVVGNAAVTAIQKMGNINSQTTILVNGATGGFGMFLLQLLKQRGAKVTAVASTEGSDFAKKWGANSVIDYTKENVLSRKETYDIVIDLSSKMGYKKAKQIMKAKALFLNPTPKPIEIPLALFKNLFTSQKHVVVLASSSTKNTNVLINAIEDGLQIEVDKVFPFAEYREAYEYAEQGGYIGKVAVEVN